MMEGIRRYSAPTQLHMIWDSLTSASSQFDSPNKGLTYVKLLNRLSSNFRDRMKRELDFAVKDGLVVTDLILPPNLLGISSNFFYKLPDISHAVLKKEGHDWYCFLCHLGGPCPVIMCSGCPRVYHKKCLFSTESYQYFSATTETIFTCSWCMKISFAKNQNNPEGLNKNELNSVLQLVISRRFTEWYKGPMRCCNSQTWANFLVSTWLESNPQITSYTWRFQFLVRLPMDLKTMFRKANEVKYEYLEEFQLDCETLLHAVAVYFGKGYRWNQIVTNFGNHAKNAIEEIQLCSDCFKHSVKEKNDDWFTLPCQVNGRHQVVWVKRGEDKFWPAKFIKVDKIRSRYVVRFFGGAHETAAVFPETVRPFGTPLSTLDTANTDEWEMAWRELTLFQQLSSLSPE